MNSKTHVLFVCVIDFDVHVTVLKGFVCLCKGDKHVRGECLPFGRSALNKESLLSGQQTALTEVLTLLLGESF